MQYSVWNLMMLTFFIIGIVLMCLKNLPKKMEMVELVGNTMVALATQWMAAQVFLAPPLSIVLHVAATLNLFVHSWKLYWCIYWVIVRRLSRNSRHHQADFLEVSNNEKD